MSDLNLGQDTAMLRFCNFAQSLQSNSASVHGLGHDRFLT